MSNTCSCTYYPYAPSSSFFVPPFKHTAVICAPSTHTGHRHHYSCKYHSCVPSSSFLMPSFRHTAIICAPPTRTTHRHHYSGTHYSCVPSSSLFMPLFGHTAVICAPPTRTGHCHHYLCITNRCAPSSSSFHANIHAYHNQYVHQCTPSTHVCRRHPGVSAVCPHGTLSCRGATITITCAILCARPIIIVRKPSLRHPSMSNQSKNFNKRGRCRKSKIIISDILILLKFPINFYMETKFNPISLYRTHYKVNKI